MFRFHTRRPKLTVPPDLSSTKLQCSLEASSSGRLSRTPLSSCFQEGAGSCCQLLNVFLKRRPGTVACSKQRFPCCNSTCASVFFRAVFTAQSHCGDIVPYRSMFLLLLRVLCILPLLPPSLPWRGSRKHFRVLGGVLAVEGGEGDLGAQRV